MERSRSYYSILEVSVDASEAEIKKSYRKLALIYHPDKTLEKDKDKATRQFQEVTEAFGTLSDPVKRRQYDLSFKKPYRSRSDMPYRSKTTERYREDENLYDDNDFFAEMQKKGPSMWNETKKTASEKRSSWGAKAKSASNFYKESRYFKSDEKRERPAKEDFVDERISAPERLEAHVEERDSDICIVLTWKRVSSAVSYKLQMRVSLESETEWKTCYEGSKRKVAVNGLEGGITYEFCVCSCGELYSSVFGKVVRQYCPDVNEKEIVHLQGMGFTRSDCVSALRNKAGNVDAALDELLKKKKKKKKKKKEKINVAPSSVRVEKAKEEEINDDEVTEQEEMLKRNLIKCSRCKEFVDIDLINTHECDLNKLHLLNFASVVGDKDMLKLKGFLDKAGGELNAACELYYSSM